MRLIDADALRASMYHEAFETDTDMQRWDGGCWIRYKMFEKNIDKAPTIEDRKTGRWALHPDPNCKGWDVCTACGTGCKRREYGTNPDGTDYVTEWSYPYCPYCGAMLEGD